MQRNSFARHTRMRTARRDDKALLALVPKSRATAEKPGALESWKEMKPRSTLEEQQEELSVSNAHECLEHNPYVLH